MRHKKYNPYYEGNKRRELSQTKDHRIFCPYCGLPATFSSGEIIWGLKYRDQMVYVCSQYPHCDSYIGVHKGTKIPMGIMANRETRYWRKMAHKTFDPLWKSGIMKRQTAYKKVSQALKIDSGDAHIGMFTVDQCKTVIALANEIQALRAKKEGVPFELDAQE